MEGVVWYCRWLNTVLCPLFLSNKYRVMSLGFVLILNVTQFPINVIKILCAFVQSAWPRRIYGQFIACDAVQLRPI